MVKPKHLHVKLTPGEFKKLKDALKASSYSKWKDWLLSLPEQFRMLHERNQFLQRQNQDLQQENEALVKRVRRLQEGAE